MPNTNFLLTRQGRCRLSQDCMMSSDLNVDRLSTLPDKIIDTILTCLPIKDAVRTSILSHRWKYEWHNMSKLRFNYRLPGSELERQTDFDWKLVEIIDKVLLLHSGPILRFILATDLNSCLPIDRWIIFCSRNGIEELSILKLRGEMYKLHSNVFSCQNLTFLELHGCAFSIPYSFKGFAKLTALDLLCVSSTDNALEVLISMCPLLKDLAIRYISGCTRVKIIAPQLKRMHVEGQFQEVCVESAPLLKVAYLNLMKSSSVPSGTKHNLVGMFTPPPSIQKIDLLGQSLRILTAGDDLPRPSTNSQLKYLSVDLNFEDMKETSAVLSCFRSSPELQKLNVKAVSDKSIALAPIDNFWEAQQDHDCQYSSVKVIKVTAFSGIKSEMKFMEFLLANAPVLETLQIEFKKEKDAGDLLTLLREIIQFPRKSEKAKIIV